VALMKLLLDTNAYTRFKQGHAPLAMALEDAETVILPTVVIGELYCGFRYGTRYKDNCDELIAFLSQPGMITADIDLNIADRYGAIYAQLRKKGTPIPTNDIWIAATVLETGARLVSYDGHFTVVPGLQVEAP